MYWMKNDKYCSKKLCILVGSQLTYPHYTTGQSNFFLHHLKQKNT
jgi:hypothetical protein